MADKKISQLTAATTPLAGTEVLPIVQSSATVKVSVANLTAGRAVSALSVTTTGNTQAAALLSVGASGTNGVTIGDYGSDAGTFRIAAITGRNLTFINDYAGVEDARFDANGNYKITRGNIVQGTAAKGINFTANTGAAGMTSQLLNWYEEGTWTVAATPSTSGTITLYSNYNTGKYIRVGGLVTVSGFIYVQSVSSPVGNLTVTGLPFSIVNNDPIGRGAGSVSGTGLAAGATTSLALRYFPGESRLYIDKFAAGSLSALASSVQADTEIWFTATYPCA